MDNQISATGEDTGDVRGCGEAPEGVSFQSTLDAIQQAVDHTGAMEGFVDCCVILDSTDEPIIPLIDNLVNPGESFAIIGQSKSFKTWFGANLCLHLACGRDFLSFRIPAPKKVLLIQMEVCQVGFSGRVRMICKATGLRPEPGYLITYSPEGKVTPESLMELTRHSFDMILIDPAYRVLKGSENDQESWNELLDVIDAIRRETGATVGFIHHDAKGLAGDRQITDRGSGSGVVGRYVSSLLTITHHRLGENKFVIETVVRSFRDSVHQSVQFVDGAFIEIDDTPEEMTSQSARSAAKSTIKHLGGYAKGVNECFLMKDVTYMPSSVMEQAVREQFKLSYRDVRTVMDTAVHEGVIFKQDKCINNLTLYALTEDALIAGVQEERKKRLSQTKMQLNKGKK